MHVAVPFDAANPKSRLAPVLDPAERRSFARATLADVLDALSATGVAPTVYATAPVELDAAPAGVTVELDERGLDALVSDLLAEPPLAVVMADLALATPAALSDLLGRDGDVVLAPGRGGGTNALVVRVPGFSVDFHGASLRDHREIASDAGLALAEVDSMRLATDVDDPADLAEVLLHGEGRAPEWLRERGFHVAVEDGRATVVRA